jgi:hypothetical protein
MRWSSSHSDKVWLASFGSTSSLHIRFKSAVAASFSITAIFAWAFASAAIAATLSNSLF